MTGSVSSRFSDRIVVGDGAMGSELFDRLPAGAVLELAPQDHPEVVLEVHVAYLKAGAELIETATFGASRPRLERHHVANLLEPLNSAAVKIAREARDVTGRDCLVAGSIGPLAGVLDLDEPEGRQQIPIAHAEQAAILAGRGADLLILETFFRLDELKLAIEAVRGVTDLPIVAMLTFPAEPEPHPYDEQAALVAELDALDVIAYGVNCAPGPAGTLEILRRTRPSSRPLAAVPNAGVLLRRDDRLLMPPATPAYLARFAREAASIGAGLIGGCCGTGPEHIKAMAEALAGVKPRPRDKPPTEAAFEFEAPRTPPPPPSRLAAKLGRGRFVRLVQLDPPKGTNAAALLSAASVLAEHPDIDAVDINSSPLARLRMDSLALAQLVQRRTGLETVPHITARDASLMGLQSQLLGAWMGGVRNVLAVTGDPSQLGDYPGVHDVYHVDVFELVRSLSRLAEGYDCAGNLVGDPPNFLVGVAVNPNVDDLKHEADRLRRKIDNGAHFVMSQVFFEWEAWESLLEQFGGRLPIPALVSVWHLLSLEMALRLHHEVPGIAVPRSLLDAMGAAGPDAAKVGYERAVSLLRDAPTYAEGVYVIAPFKRPEQVIPLLDDGAPEGRPEDEPQ